MSRLSELQQSLPPGTLLILSVLGAIYFCQIIFDPDLRDFTLSPQLVLSSPLRESYRLVTSTLFHGNLVHIAMNGMTTLALGQQLERHYLGTTQVLLMTCLSILVTPSLHIMMAWSATLVGYAGWMKEHSLGFSGVLFHWSVLESSLFLSYEQSRSTRSVFGMIQVPSRLYPWALLVVLQMFMPNLSFLGHLSGIIAGTLHLHFFPRGVMVSGCAAQMETKLETWKNFVPTPEVGASTFRDSNNGGLCQVCGAACTYVYYILETLQYIIFGRRGQQETVAAGDHEEDEEWNGLPLIANAEGVAGETSQRSEIL